jgi:hypothetical protein
VCYDRNSKERRPFRPTDRPSLGPADASGQDDDVQSPKRQLEIPQLIEVSSRSPLLPEPEKSSSCILRFYIRASAWKSSQWWLA